MRNESSLATGVGDGGIWVELIELFGYEGKLSFGKSNLGGQWISLMLNLRRGVDVDAHDIPMLFQGAFGSAGTDFGLKFRDILEDVEVFLLVSEGHSEFLVFLCSCNKGSVTKVNREWIDVCQWIEGWWWTKEYWRLRLHCWSRLFRASQSSGLLLSWSSRARNIGGYIGESSSLASFTFLW